MTKTKNGTSLLRLWMREATTEQQERLARAADTTRAQSGRSRCSRMVKSFSRRYTLAL